MQIVSELLAAKSAAGETLEVWTIQPYASVYDAIESMARRDVGALVVTDGLKPVGIVSERDYARKGVLRRRFAMDTLVADIMVNPMICVTSDDDLRACMQLMIGEGVRHLPVVDDGELTGMISMGDLLKWVLDDTMSQERERSSSSWPSSATGG